MEPFIIGAVIFVIFIGSIIAFIIHKEKQRKLALKEFAIRNGLTYQENIENVFSENLHFKTFHTGHNKKTTNVLKGMKNGVDTTIFDYKYTIGYGKNAHTYHQTFALARINKVLPVFSLGPEKWFHKIAEHMGLKDIDFEHYPEFSRLYLLKGESEHAIRNVFTPEIIKYFEQHIVHGYLEVNNNELIYYDYHKRIKPENMQKFIDMFTGIVNQLNKTDHLDGF